MGYKNLKFVVRRRKTTSRWIDDKIRATDDIEDLRILASSPKVSPHLLEYLWMEVPDYELTLVIARNSRSSPELLRNIFFDIWDNRFGQTWTVEQCDRVFLALLDNSQAPEELIQDMINHIDGMRVRGLF